MMDVRLREAANMVSSLIDSNEISLASAAATLNTADFSPHTTYERQLSCQIWSFAGSLVGRSSGAPQTRLSDSATGFSEREVDGARWRVYAVRNEAAGVEVLVGDNIAFREHIARDMLLGLTVPMMASLPVLALILWLAVGRGLAPLSRLAHRLEARGAQDLAPLGEADAAAEIRPVVSALNGLFARVGDLMGREREFLAMAAHELRTPLSGLKTQAEVALRSPDAARREAALGRILAGVDRSARLVRQLLAFGEAETAPVRCCPVALGTVIEGACEEAGARLEAEGKRLLVDRSVAPVRLSVPEALLGLAIRNLVENAANYAGATVWIAWRDGAVVIDDDGPGMAEAERAEARRRFFRGSNRKGAGSGLGLSIVDVCAGRMDASLVLDERPSGGFRAALRFAPARVLPACSADADFSLDVTPTRRGGEAG